MCVCSVPILRWKLYLLKQKWLSMFHNVARMLVNNNLNSGLELCEGKLKLCTYKTSLRFVLLSLLTFCIETKTKRLKKLTCSPTSGRNSCLKG